MKKNLREIRLLPIVGRGTYQTVYKDGEFVYKVIDISSFNLDSQIISKDIRDFYNRCQKNEIRVPKKAMIPLFEEDKYLVNKYSFEGSPFNKNIDFLIFKKIYRQLLEYVCNGLNNGLGVSSFNEQYVINQDGLIFVDFFIPAISPNFLNYRYGQDALNYYLVQFSKNSSFLSCYSHYLFLFPQYADFIKSSFNKLFKKKELFFPLVRRTMDSENFNWGLNNFKLINANKNKWLLIRNKEVFLGTDSVQEIIDKAGTEDIIIYNSKKRFFLKEELEIGVSNFKKLIHETN